MTSGSVDRLSPISFPEPALPLSSGAGNGRILGADQKDRSLWERDWAFTNFRESSMVTRTYLQNNQNQGELESRAGGTRI